jgi:hypothetical protein
MYSFFVLGIIPGTTIQITFQGWLDAVELAIALYCTVWLYRHRRAIRATFSRTPLPANQLHQRLSF